MYEKSHSRFLATSVVVSLAALFLVAGLFTACASGGAGDDPAVVTPVVETPATETPNTETPSTETPATETPAKSSIATLSALTVSAGTLTPAFDPAVTAYTVELESSVKSFTVNGTASDAKATVSESGAAARTLAIGETAIALTVTAEDGTAKAYTVTAFRKPVVYAVGWYSTLTAYVACVWRGTERTDLAVPAGATSAYATGICISGGSVYISGWYNSLGTKTPCYWKDGARTDLSAGDTTTETYAITVSGASVYVAGYYSPASNDGKYAPCYWKDGVLTELDHPDDKYGWASGITVADGEVYTSGYYSLDGYDLYACYWKGSAKTDLAIPSSTKYCYANSIAVSGGSVYVGGGYSADRDETDPKGAWWKDGVRTDVVATGGAKTWVTDLALDDGAVSLAGYAALNGDTGGNSPVMWKSGEQTALPVQAAGYAAEIAMLDGRAYLAGQTLNGLTGSDTRDVACIWEAGARRDLETTLASDVKDIALGE